MLRRGRKNLKKISPTREIACRGFRVWCEGGDLNPYELKRSLEPESSASANSATLAYKD
ncbi:protein of unknown function [Ruminococcaceae bacterium BL-6]|nr:protein of unknown function [Ruminococcaceae bacterium BL-6]